MTLNVDPIIGTSNSEAGYSVDIRPLRGISFSYTTCPYQGILQGSSYMFTYEKGRGKIRVGGIQKHMLATKAVD
jgi:hypothetical protein